MKIVVALGGNALGKTPSEQKHIVKRTATRIAEIVRSGNDVIITHGNGPQVGMIYKSFQLNGHVNNTESMPMAECGAMSQGYIGFDLETALKAEFEKFHIKKNVVTVVTSVVVDKNDPGFKNPTKPIGDFYTKAKAKKLSVLDNAIYKEDSGRGYRRVIASPIPKDILEIDTIKTLSDQGNVVIACGGGGIPVVKCKNGYKGVEAVIDKDKTSALLAKLVEADILLILTTVEKVRINYNKPNEKKLDHLTINEALKYISDGEFAPGSMLPKIESCVYFAKNGHKAIITSLTKALKAIQGLTGTVIEEDKNG